MQIFDGGIFKQEGIVYRGCLLNLGGVWYMRTLKDQYQIIIKMVLVQQSVPIWTKAIDFVKTMLSCFLIAIMTIFGMSKESDKYSKDEINNLTKGKFDFLKPKFMMRPGGGGRGLGRFSRPKVMRGLSGTSQCGGGK